MPDNSLDIMKTSNFFFILLISLMALGCSSPYKLYEKGKYFKAFDKALDDLNDGKKDRKILTLLNNSFEKMMVEAREKMRFLDDGYNVKDLKHNFKQYEEVEKRYVKGRSYINDTNDLLYAEFAADKEHLLEDTYAEGRSLMAHYDESNNKIDARNAYHHFELVEKYGQDYSDIDMLLEEALEAATIVYNVDADLDSDFSYQWKIDWRFDDLEGKGNFIRIVYDNSSVDSDCNVELDFARLDVEERKEESSQDYTLDIIDHYKTETDTSGQTTEIPVYKEVSGSVVTKKLTKIVSWRVDLEIVSSNQNCDLREETFRESVEHRVEIYDLRGDLRAIPEEFKNSTNEQVKDTDEMVEDLIDDLYTRIRNYFY